MKKRYLIPGDYMADPSVHVFEGKVYMAEKLDEHHHRVTLDYNQACGQFCADICEDGALINTVAITIRSRVGTINDDNGFFDS